MLFKSFRIFFCLFWFNVVFVVVCVCVCFFFWGGGGGGVVCVCFFVFFCCCFLNPKCICITTMNLYL